MDIPDFIPDPDFYQKRLEYVCAHLSDERRKRSFPAIGSEDRLRPIVSLQTELLRYIEKRNKVIELNAVTTLPSVEIARMGGRPVNLYLINVGHFEGQYQYAPSKNTIYGSAFNWREIEFPLAP
ncbi:MAG: hypothetical protein BM562_17200 [Alphaproteobacteria bacterium MedPE-SWcel]|nr:MAG: hypothetical protein BM562_17200 [Alphaproteobacteria bacterium MedPE-SWcel]